MRRRLRDEPQDRVDALPRCSPGEFSPGLLNCTKCSVGSYSGTRAEACLLCDFGTYQSKRGGDGAARRQVDQRPEWLVRVHVVPPQDSTLPRATNCKDCEIGFFTGAPVGAVQRPPRGRTHAAAGNRYLRPEAGRYQGATRASVCGFVHRERRRRSPGSRAATRTPARARTASPG